MFSSSELEQLKSHFTREQRLVTSPFCPQMAQIRADERLYTRAFEVKNTILRHNVSTQENGGMTVLNARASEKLFYPGTEISD
mgnify:CR=1 FL=1